MSQEFDRFMLYHGVGTEEKLATLTDSEFRAHIAGVLAIASQSPMRGYLFVGEIEAQPVHIARKAGVTERVVKSAMTKLREVGILTFDEEVGGWQVHNWEAHQAERRDPTAAERARAYRARRKASRDASRDDVASVTSPSRNPSRARGLPEGVEVEVEGVGVANAPPTVRAGAGLADVIDDVVAILAQCDHLYRNRMAIENVVIAWPGRDPVLAARTVVSWASDPAFRSTNGAKLLGDALSKQSEKKAAGRSKPERQADDLAALQRLTAGGASA